MAFLLLNDILEILFGGAAGGGKSIGLLAAASQYVNVPGYAALLLRRRFRDLALPGALMDIAHKWWDSTDAVWDKQNYKWTFPSGAVIQFGYLQHAGDEHQYQSAAFQMIGVDEVTQFTEEQYTYMFSRLRRPENPTDAVSSIPLRMRGASNPGGPGHEWVKRRFQIKMLSGVPFGIRSKTRLFLLSKLDDNPYLHKESYEEALSQLSSVTYAQLRSGDWSAVHSGGVFDPLHFQIISPDDLPDRRYWQGVIRHWDTAATEVSDSNSDPDYTAGCKMIKSTLPPPSIVKWFQDRMEPLPPAPYWIILNMQRDRRNEAGVEELVSATAHDDGLHVPVSFGQERGSAGKLAIAAYSTHVIPGFRVLRFWATGDKVTRARLVVGPAGQGRFFVVDGPWVEAFLDEVGIFTGKKGVHDDQVDAMTGAFIQLDRLELMGGGEEADQW